MMEARLLYASSAEASECVKKDSAGLVLIKSACFWSSVDIWRIFSPKDVKSIGVDVASEFIMEINFSTSKSARLRLLWMGLVGYGRYY